MLIHIIPTNLLFGRYGVEHFETVLPGGNRFVMVLAEGASTFNAQVVEGLNCERVVVGTGAYDRLLEDLSRADCVVFHSFQPRFTDMLKRCPPSCVTAWVLWGGEVYNTIPSLFRKTLQPITRSLYPRVLIENKGVLRLARRILGPLFPSRLLVRLVYMRRSWLLRGFLRALHRLDYILTFVEEEVEFIREHGLSEASYLPFAYYSLERTVGQHFLRARADGGDILLGNSASLTSNHLDAFETLRKLDLTGRRVVCPLSYGDAAYAKMAAEAGRRRLGDAFLPLMDFLPIDEYNEILAKCGVVVMNHNRQQAMGNIITALWLGAKVCLNDDTTVWRYLRRNGIDVRSISRELRPGNPAALDPLPAESVERNRAILLREFSYDTVLDRCRRAVKEILGGRGL